MLPTAIQKTAAQLSARTSNLDATLDSSLTAPTDTHTH